MEPWTKPRIIALLQTNDRAVERALLALHQAQTPAERAERATIEANGRGFNSVDAWLCSTLAQRLAGGHALTKGQLAIARRRVLKYSGQLLKIAQAKEAASCP